MAIYSENDAGRARDIISRLFNRDREVELPEGLSIYDLEMDIQSFQNESRFLYEFRLPLIALKMFNGDRIPISLRYLTYPDLSWIFNARYSNFEERYFQFRNSFYDNYRDTLD